MISIRRGSKTVAEVMLRAGIGGATANIGFYPIWYNSPTIDTHNIVNDRTQATALLLPPAKFTSFSATFHLQCDALPGDMQFVGQIEHTPGNAILAKGHTFRTATMNRNHQTSGAFVHDADLVSGIQSLRVKYTARINGFVGGTLIFNILFFEG